MIGKVTEKLDILKMHEVYQSVFDGPEGREVLRHICKRGHVFDSTHVVGDSHLSALREGERRLALSILKYVNKDHASLINELATGD